jgi:hypothetical protein
MVNVVRGVIVAFGALNLALAIWWIRISLRTRREAQGSGEHLGLNARALLSPVPRPMPR